MTLTIIVGVVVFYFLLMFLLHELFRKFFHMLLFIGTGLFVIALLYLMFKGV